MGLSGARFCLSTHFSLCGEPVLKRGKESVREAVQKAQGVYVDDGDRVLTSAYALQLLFARRTALTGRIGFGLITLGFLMDLISKW